MKLKYRRNRTTKSNIFNIETFVDASFATSEEEQRLVSGYTTYLNGNIINWGSKRQRYITRSTAAAEMVALDDSLKGTFELKDLIISLGSECHTTVFEDNQPLITRCSSLVAKFNDRQYLNVILQSLREEVSAKLFKIVYIPSDRNIADTLTKPLPRNDFNIKTELLIERNDIDLTKVYIGFFGHKASFDAANWKAQMKLESDQIRVLQNRVQRLIDDEKCNEQDRIEWIQDQQARLNPRGLLENAGPGR